MLAAAEGFVDTGVDGSYAKCQGALEQVFRHISGIAQDLKVCQTFLAYRCRFCPA